ncbi:MAG: GNAT family N-acetyltransferase [Anaerolineales bacterium]|nr:GNAT family N-acetyltransferase [Anaerolineales bacterium]
MIRPLPISQSSLLRPLFAHFTRTQPMCAAVLEGIYPGKLYVDDLAQPRSALLTTFIESEAHGAWGYLAGDPANDLFNHALNAAIFSRQVVPIDSPVLLLTCDPDDWGGQLDAVFAPRPPIWFPRYHFICRQVRFDWRSALPAGFTVERITPDLAAIPGVHLPEDVAATLAKWQSITDSRFIDFGFVTLDRSVAPPVIASWATVDFIAGGSGDLGFLTQPEYRRRSLGTIAVSAALEHAFAIGLQQVNWTCDADNPGSVRTAEKLGLERIGDYRQAVLVMDEQRHMALYHQQQ